MKRLIPAVLLLAGLAACSDSTGPDPLTELTVTPSPAYTQVGDTVHLRVTGEDENGQTVSPNASFRSENPQIATVNGNGVVKGISVGTTEVVASAGGATERVTVNVLPAGSLLSLNVNPNENCTNPIIKKGRIAATSQRAIFVEDVTNPAGGFTDQEYATIAAAFDNLIYPIDVANFGAPSDIDKNGKVVVFYTRAVNELTPPGAGFIIGGFFYSRDLFPRTTQGGLGGCAGSNVAEIFYMLAVDPTGAVNGHIRDKEYVRGSTIGTLAHEFQHLINASRRLYVNTTAEFPEQAWLDEGLSHIAEELAFYAASGLAPRQNIGQQTIFASTQRLNAFNEYGVANFGRYQQYLRSVSSQGPTEENDDDLETRGAAWGLLRYLADRRAGNDQTLWFGLANSRDTGYTALVTNLGTDPLPWIRDWTVANYTDDAGAPVEARFTHPSWNFRDLYSNAAFGGYPLEVFTLANGAPRTVNIRAASAAYFKFGVAGSATADLRVAAAGTTVDGPCTAVSLAVGQVYQGPGPSSGALCFTAPATGAVYTLVAFHAAVGTGTVGITVSGTGITAPVGGPNPSISASPDLAAQALFRRDLRQVIDDGGFHMRLRERERSGLAELARGELRPMRSVAAAPAPATVIVQVARVR